MPDLEWNAADFRQWLVERQAAQRSDDDEVGYRNNCEDCPVAVWRRHLGEYLLVEGEQVTQRANRSVVFTPPVWAIRFVTRLDLGIVTTDTPVTAAECLAILDSLS